MSIVNENHLNTAYMHLNRHKNDNSMRYMARLNRSLGRKRAEKVVEEVAQAIEISGGKIDKNPRWGRNPSGQKVRFDGTPAFWRVTT